MVDAYWKAFNLKNAPKTSSSGGSKSSGGTSYPKSGTAGGDYEGLFAAALASGRPASFIPNNYKKYGFSSSSGLVSDYNDWAAEQESQKKTTAKTAAPPRDNGYGANWNTIWPRARTMFDQGRSKNEIAAYLNNFSKSQLTDAGLNKILSSLGF